MKILHTSDWHIGKVVNDFSLIEDQRFFLDSLCALILDEKPDVMLISGDLYDRSIPPTDAVKLLDETLTKIVCELKTPVFAISGNHDSPTRLSFCTSLLEKQGLVIKGEHKKEMEKITLSDNFGEVNFYFLPFVESVYLKRDFENETFSSLNDVFNRYIEYNSKNIDKSSRNILLAHGFFSLLSKEKAMENSIFSSSETSVGACDLINADLISKTFDYTALGHLHSPQQVAQNVRYSGSILKYSDSETTQNKSVTIIELNEKNNIKIKTVSLPPLRDMRRVIGTFEEISNSPKTKDYIFAVITDENYIMDASNKLRNIFPNLMGIRFTCLEKEKTLSEVTVETIREKSTEQLFKDFYKSIMPSQMNTSQEKIINKIIELSQKGEGDE